MRKLSLYLQSALYLLAGINHLWHPAPYLAIMPTYFGWPAQWVFVSGLCEIAGAIGLLIPRTRNLAAYGIAAMLVVYLTVHVDMIVGNHGHYPLWLLYGRLALQPALILWALSSRVSGFPEEKPSS